MFAAISSAWALLLGIALIMLGNGLQNTLLGVRATLEGFGTGVTGLVMTAYFVGFVAGSTIVPRLLANVGHIRVFAALASLASSAVLVHTVFVTPLTWGLVRIVTGFCFAGLYVVAESWINEAATNKTRGQLLSVYMIMVLGGTGSGQLLMNLSDPRGFELFVLVSVLISVALIPITLSVGRAPPFEAPESIGVRALFRASPLGVAGAFLIGIAHAALYTMGPVFGTEIGLSVERVSLFIAAALFGGLVLQWPIGWLSDRFDRRRVIVAVAWVATGASFAAGAGGVGSYPLLIVSTALLGGMSMPLYSLCGAHTNDHLTPPQIVAASATLVLVGGFGLMMGPSLAAALMQLAGPRGDLLAACPGARRHRRVRPVPDDAPRAGAARRAAHLRPGEPAHVADRAGADGQRGSRLLTRRSSAKMSPIHGCGRGSDCFRRVERGQGARRTVKYACAP